MARKPNFSQTCWPFQPWAEGDEEIEATAVMVCWNALPFADPDFVRLYVAVRRVDPEGVTYDVLLAEVQNLAVVRHA